MFFRKKVDRVIQVEEAEERFEQEFEQEKIGKKDMFAMIIAGFAVFLPALLFVAAIFLFVIWFLTDDEYFSNTFSTSDALSSTTESVGSSCCGYSPIASS